MGSMFNELGYIALLVEGTVGAGRVRVAANRDWAAIWIVVVRVVSGKSVALITCRKFFASSVVGVPFDAILRAPVERSVVAVTRGVRSGTTLRLIK